jgi:hypothetical protein
MAARANSLEPDDLSGATLEMVREMVRRAEAKLSSLQSRRTQIRRRIQALHHLSRTVAAGKSAPLLNDCRSQTDEPAKEQVLKKREGQSFIDEPRENTSRESESSALRRACRIALMESDAAECCVQILQRITRRESVSFKNHGDPTQEIISELNRMVAHSEAITFGAGDAQLWQLNRLKNQREPHSTAAL